MLQLLLMMTMVAGAEPVEIASSELKLVIDSETGSFLSLEDGATGEPLLRPGSCPVFQIQSAGDDGGQVWNDSSGAEAVAADVDGDTVRIEYSNVADGISAVVTVMASPESRELRMKIDVTNDSDAIIDYVVFPKIEMARPLGESVEDDRLFIPGGDGCLVRAEGMERQTWHRREYPGSASMQFWAHFDETLGLSIICEDTDAGPKMMGASLAEGLVDMAAWLRRPYLPGEDYNSPWFSLRKCAGSWMNAAQDYREWAREQWWAQPKTGDLAPAQWISESPTVLSLDWRPMGNGDYFIPLERANEHVRIWKEAIGADSVMVETRNFEAGGCYTSPRYFPLFPSVEKIQDVLGKLHADGVHNQAMVAGLKWMYKREAFHTPHYNILAYDAEEDWLENGQDVCAVGRDGEVFTREAGATWDGDCAFICPATDFAKEHFRTTARALAEAGFDLFEFDQMNGGVCQPCYSMEHDHPPGYGPWMVESIQELMRITRDEGRKINPNFGLSMEDPGELYVQHLDTYCSRANHVNHWPGIGPGSRVVPAFYYAYHPIIPSTNFDIRYSTQPDDFTILRNAKAFVSGAGLAMQMTEWQVLNTYEEGDRFPTPDKCDAHQVEQLRNAVRTRDGSGRSYLVSGEMLQPMDIDTPLAEYPRVRTVGKERISETVSEEAVLHSAWMNAQGDVAFFFANMTRDPVSFTFAPETAEWT
ncbi:MAG TPA: DUF6259 domain-containing protein, partial [Armatimonadota bacterium]|nr:DUF6259 domain-containing protein [Armatimonadota bacterium]